MSLYKRGGIWWMRFTTPDHRELRETTQTADRRQAQELHDARRADLWRIAKLGERPRHTWEEAVVRWFDDHPDRAGLPVIKTALRQAHPFLAGQTIDRINRDALAAFVRAQRAAGLASSTINLRLTLIRAVLNAAVAWGWIDAAPQHKALPVTERRIRWLTRDEAARLIQELPPHLAAMARFSLATGLRESNVCRLEWSQIDLERRVGWIHPDQAKARRSLAVPLNAEAIIVLREQQGQHSRWVFPYRGRPLRRANNAGWAEALKRAGITDFHWHDLRHTWASWHVQAGTPLVALKELGGWASLAMVLRYAHLGADHLAEHAARISGPRLVRTNPGTVQEKTTTTG
jgi:integrase